MYTLYLSSMMFIAGTYHKLLKDDKLQTDDINNPRNDSLKARDLFYDEVEAVNNYEATKFDNNILMML